MFIRHIDTLLEWARKPEPFTESTAPFWDDPHISKQMLKAHLDPTFDAASRALSTIEASVRWFHEQILPPAPADVLDLGCGPGLYASALARLGYKVTGLDISRRSLAYAQKKAEKEELSIEYCHQNYLHMEYKEAFHAALLIFCDFGVFSPRERLELLQKVKAALRPGGLFLFDVNTPRYNNINKEGRSWEVVSQGFWSEKPHLVLEETFSYPEEKLQLNQYLVIMDNGKTEAYRVWDQHYDQEDLADLLEQAGFKTYQFFSDLTGKAYDKNSPTLAVKAIKG